MQLQIQQKQMDHMHARIRYLCCEKRDKPRRLDVQTFSQLAQPAAFVVNFVNALLSVITPHKLFAKFVLLAGCKQVFQTWAFFVATIAALPCGGITSF